jgi:hypothetical protein
MTQVQAHYQAVREAEARLKAEYGDFLYTTSIENTARGQVGGSVSEVTVRTAAEQIVKGQARVATEAEIEAFKAKAERFRRSIASQDNAYKYRSVV